jgi:hypothetical protein
LHGNHPQLPRYIGSAPDHARPQLFGYRPIYAARKETNGSRTLDPHSFPARLTVLLDELSKIARSWV